MIISFYSHDLNEWFSSITVRRNWKLVTFSVWRVKKMNWLVLKWPCFEELWIREEWRVSLSSRKANFNFHAQLCADKWYVCILCSYCWWFSAHKECFYTRKCREVKDPRLRSFSSRKKNTFGIVVIMWNYFLLGLSFNFRNSCVTK